MDAVRLDRAAEAARQRVREETRKGGVHETPLMTWGALSEIDRQAWRLAVLDAVAILEGEKPNA